MFVTRLTKMIGILLAVGIGSAILPSQPGTRSAPASANNAAGPAPQRTENVEKAPPTQAAQEREATSTKSTREFADPKSQNAARIQLMKETAARIHIGVQGNEGATLELAAEPIMRWDNDRSRVVDASAFVWFDQHRPQVIGGTWIKNGQAFFELQSLSSEPLTATVDGTKSWSSSRPGISWEGLAGAPAPAASRGERLRQMKQLARDFSVYAVKTGPDYDEGSVWHLRMLVQPIHRYAEDAAVDGAIFAFAQGTDPEAFLILESRRDKGIHLWHFAMASACIWELHATRGALEVWSRPKWGQRAADTGYGLVGPFAVDPKLLLEHQIDSQPAP